MQFNGIYVPVITHFNDDFSINEAGTMSIIDGAINAGVQGIIVGGTTGEYYAMDKAERVRTFHLAKEAVAGRVPLIAGVGLCALKMLFILPKRHIKQALIAYYWVRHITPFPPQKN